MTNVMGIDPCDNQNFAVFNATTQKQNWVDPRTGLFEVHVPLPSVTGNNGNGPVVDLSLFYTPVCNNRAGLGDGWSFAFTTYDEAHSQLTLHTGEVLTVNRGKALRTDAVLVHWIDNHIRVERRDGRVEILKQQSTSKIYVPDTLTTDGYHFLNISWECLEHYIDGVTHYQILLLGIKDPVRKLFKVDYALNEGSGTISFTFWPGDSAESFFYVLNVKDYILGDVTLPNVKMSSFNYTTHPGCGELLVSITSFEDVVEKIDYDSNGHKFPEGTKLNALPSVSRHTVTCQGRPELERTFTYSADADDGGSRTTIAEAGQTITYTYSSNNELVSESSLRGQATCTKKYEHQGSGSAIETTYTHGGRSRNEWVESTFVKGALKKNTQPGGSVKYLFFSDLEKLESNAEVEFSRVLNDLESKAEKAEIPYSKFLGVHAKGGSWVENFPSKYTVGEVHFDEALNSPDSIIMSKRYQYVRVGRLYGLKVGHLAVVTNVAGDYRAAALINQLTEYYESHDFKMGRTRKVSQFGARDKAYTPADKQEWTYDYTLEGTALTTTTIQKASDGTERKTTQTHSVLSGRLLSQVDEDGNKATFQYDHVGRLRAHTACAQSETYQQTTYYDYDYARTVQIKSPDGRKQLITYDGFGNLIEEDEEVQGQSWPWRAILQVTYDALGRKQRITRHDAIDSDTASDWCEINYDDWGQECGRVYSNGQKVFNQYDPVSLTRTEWTGTDTDRHATVTTYGEDGSINKIEYKDEDGNIYQTQTNTYGHANYLASQTTVGVSGKHAITYTYDGVGRLTSEAHVETDGQCRSYTYHYGYPANWLITEAQTVAIEFDGKKRTLGERTFDVWGRATSLTRGDVTETFTYSGASQVPSSRTGADGSTLNYEYIGELGNRIAKVSLGSDESTCKTFSYATGSQTTSSAGEGERLLTCQHDLYSRLISRSATAEGATAKTVAHAYSPGGRLLQDTDVFGNVTQYAYANHERGAANNDRVKTAHSMYENGRIDRETVTPLDQQSGIQLTIDYVYDKRGRETLRSFAMFGATFIRLESEYQADNKLMRVTLNEYGEIIASREFRYTAGGRLARCITSGVWRPKTPKGHPIHLQQFTYDAFGNVITCVTGFGRDRCTSTYTYDDTSSSRLIKVEHDHADYPRSKTLSYDSCGRITQDQTGKKYAYDWLGRLVQAGSVRYTYDPMDQLLTRSQGGSTQQIVYDGLEVRGEYDLNTDSARYLHAGSAACTAQTVRKAGVERMLLHLRDASGSVIITHDCAAGSGDYNAYSAYGEHFSDDKESLIGFNGEYLDRDNQQYPLGQGYRWYAPESMQFHAQDSLSPFGEGGRHAYRYCAGDPINASDPTGHVGSGAVNRGLRKIWGDRLPGPMGLGEQGGLINTILWSGLGVLTAIVSGGASLLIAAALVGLAIVSAATAIAAVVVADSDPELAATLGWVSLASAVAAGVVTILRKVGQLAVQLGRSVRLVARNMYNRAAVGLARRSIGGLASPRKAYRPLSGADFRTADEIAEALAPVDTREFAFFHFDTKEVTQQSRLSKVLADTLRIFDTADTNTMVCAVTGVLGNAGYFDSEGDQFINGNVNNATWLPWGNFNVGRYR